MSSAAQTPPRKPHLDRVAMIVMLMCCAFWGFQQVLIKKTVSEVPPILQVSIRFIGATLLLFL
jgi:drug/metabolite transporter (DMT)-like permease